MLSVDGAQEGREYDRTREGDVLPSRANVVPIGIGETEDAPRPSSSSRWGSCPSTAGRPTTTAAAADLPSSFARITLLPLSSVVSQFLTAPGGH